MIQHLVRYRRFGLNVITKNLLYFTAHLIIYNCICDESRCVRVQIWVAEVLEHQRRPSALLWNLQYVEQSKI